MEIVLVITDISIRINETSKPHRIWIFKEVWRLNIKRRRAVFRRKCLRRFSRYHSSNIWNSSNLNFISIEYSSNFEHSIAFSRASGNLLKMIFTTVLRNEKALWLFFYSTHSNTAIENLSGCEKQKDRIHTSILPRFLF